MAGERRAATGVLLEDHGLGAVAPAPRPGGDGGAHPLVHAAAARVRDVRDYCDSADHLPALATANGDLKDVQRPWTLKAILGRVPRGGRLLEIGAGDPHVADILARIGYDVTLIDPYDGRDRGPSAYEAIVAAYPHLTVVRGLFPDALDDDAGSFDCIYSISVLEHLPKEAIPALWEGIRMRTSPGGVTIHAIDHVHQGAVTTTTSSGSA